MAGRRPVHGTPITPKRLLPSLAGSSFCVSFYRPDQVNDVIELVGHDQILILDNGAFSIWRSKQMGRKLTQRLQFDTPEDYRLAFWDWANDIQARCDQAVAVIPDVIEGSEHGNLLEVSHAIRYGLADYPAKCMAIWHMDESIEQLKVLSQLMNFVGIGSCQKFDVQKDRSAYMARLLEASQAIDEVEHQHSRRPWVHLMRGLGVYSEAVRFESADSCNLAMNHCYLKEQHGDDRARVMHDRIKGQIDDVETNYGPAMVVSNFEQHRSTLDQFI
jgi:hypothetical protein